jgi:hypothetical protein
MQMMLLLSMVASAGAEPPEAKTPPAIEAYAASRGGSADKISRDERADVGEYRAYEVSVLSEGPGDPGHWTFYGYKGEPWLETKGDWSGFLRAAPPHTVAKALARPLDQLLRSAETPADVRSHNLQVIPYDQIEPALTVEGTLVFFVKDGRGDPPSGDVFRVTAAPKPEGGVDIQRVWVRRGR